MAVAKLPTTGTRIACRPPRAGWFNGQSCYTSQHTGPGKDAGWGWDRGGGGRISPRQLRWSRRTRRRDARHEMSALLPVRSSAPSRRGSADVSNRKYPINRSVTAAWGGNAFLCSQPLKKDSIHNSMDVMHDARLGAAIRVALRRRLRFVPRIFTL